MQSQRFIAILWRLAAVFALVVFGLSWLYGCAFITRIFFGGVA